MKVYCLVGKSGTGKSFQAINLCRQMNIESIIDDGLFICHNKVIAGISAKRQPTQFAAVKTALFDKDWHAQEVIDAIAEEDPESILVLGTSDRMVEKIRVRLQLDPPEKTIYIEDITTEEEREVAYKQRHDMGKHVIPAPTFQLKKTVFGLFHVADEDAQGIGNQESDRRQIRSQTGVQLPRQIQYIREGHERYNRMHQERSGHRIRDRKGACNQEQSRYR